MYSKQQWLFFKDWSRFVRGSGVRQYFKGTAHCNKRESVCLCVTLKEYINLLLMKWPTCFVRRVEANWGYKLNQITPLTVYSINQRYTLPLLETKTYQICFLSRESLYTYDQVCQWQNSKLCNFS